MRLLVWVAVAAVGVVGVFVAGERQIASNREPTPPPVSPCADGDGAYEAAVDYVRVTLIAPRDAVFAQPGQRGVDLVYHGDCRYSVIGYVDAQNYYGVFLRDRFNALVEYRDFYGHGYWDLIDLEMD